VLDNVETRFETGDDDDDVSVNNFNIMQAGCGVVIPF
jgi:hypothetical protein